MLLKDNSTNARVVFVRTLQLVSGGGLQINGKHTFCGDYIYSGHTLVLVMTYLVVKECKKKTQHFYVLKKKSSNKCFLLDSPRRYWHLHWIVWLVSSTGIFCILISRGHYTIDVLIAYYITTRVFWLYHTLANTPSLQVQKYFSVLLSFFKGAVVHSSPTQVEIYFKVNYAETK